MATLTIYPVENGSLAENSPNTGTAWAAVDDPAGTPDDDTTYLAGGGISTYKYNTFYVRSVPVGTISSVVLRWRGKYVTTSTKARTYCKVDGSWQSGSEQTMTTSYANYSTTLTAPSGGWTPTKLAEVEFGVGIYNTSGRVTQCYLEVTYTAGDLTVSSNTTTAAKYVLDAGKKITINSGVTLTRDAGLKDTLIYGPSGGNIVYCYGTIEGNRANCDSGDKPLIWLVGTGNSVQGASNTARGTIKGNRHTGIMFDDPVNCFAKWINVEDMYSAETDPVQKVGVGILFWGYGGLGSSYTGNYVTYCSIKRSGLHGIQICDCDGGEVSYCEIDGTYANFGISGFGYGDTPSGINIHHNTIRNSRAEWINLQNMNGLLKIEDNTAYNTRADYGYCAYICAATNGSIARNKGYYSYSEGITLDACSGFVVESNELYDCARGGDHHAGIKLQGSDDGNAQNNTVQLNKIVDLRHYLLWGIKEVNSGTGLAKTNTISNNTIYAPSAVLPVSLIAGNGSLQS